MNREREREGNVIRLGIFTKCVAKKLILVFRLYNSVYAMLFYNNKILESSTTAVR